MSVDRATRTLEVLRTQYEQHEKRAGEAMAKALRAHSEAQAWRAQCEQRRAEAREERERFARSQRVATGARVDAASLSFASGFRARLDEQLRLAEQTVHEATQRESVALAAVDAARRALAEAKGRVEVVTRRIAAIVKAQRDKIEAQVEEEAADRYRPR